MINDINNFKMADSIEKSFETMVKTHCVIITAQVDMNLIVLCERIMELQPGSRKKMNEQIIKNLDLYGGWCRLLTLF